MRVVADTGVLVSAFLWSGIPHQLLVAAEQRRLSLYTSLLLIEELAGVLSRPKFRERLLALEVTADDLLEAFLKLAHLVRPGPIPPTIVRDPDDDHVLACALAAGAHYIVSGDHHLLTLKRYGPIPILPPRVFLTRALMRAPRA